ncbi:hypothetical protein Y1Q_0010594 [Alligator mississippiensis]|uniref:Ig-like domain-containing protein n=1 Tax=Alligator mississippiensis TaxID=8496 RepID=A0A151PHG1_ALLMI|nr:hypothetical protein Y1Q_0010594 [Alligator mississippiensis]
MEMRFLLSLLVVTLCPGAALADAIQSAAAQVSAAEGGTVTLRCSYNTSYNAAYYLYWYRQYPNRTLQYLLYRGAKTAKSASSTADFARERFSSETDDTSTEMKIRVLEQTDTAVYHCALQRHSDRVTRESCTNIRAACTRKEGPSRETSEDTLISSFSTLGGRWR